MQWRKLNTHYEVKGIMLETNNTNRGKDQTGRDDNMGQEEIMTKRKAYNER